VDIPARVCFTYKTGISLKPGQRVLVPLGNRKLIGWIMGYVEDEGKYHYKNILKVYDDYPLIPKHLIELAREISIMCFCSIGNVLSAISGKLSLKTISPPPQQPLCVKKHPEKYPFVNNILRDMSSTGKKAVLVRFYDIRGKIRFFRHIAESIDGSLIFVFSTISDTEKIFYTLRGIFGENVLHISSEGGKKQKTLCWLRMLNGNNLIMVGTRIALFSPVSDIKMIIVDEPSEYGHKEKQSPRYNSREIALKISEMRDIPVLFTTIQPDITDVFLYKSGRIGLVEDSASTFQNPQVVISRLEKNWQSTILTNISRHLLEKTLIGGKKAVIIHNIKGYARIIVCKKCGAAIKCPACGDTLVPVSEDYSFCGRDKKFFKTPLKCPVCKRGHLKIKQPGIKKIVDVLRQTYSEFGITVISKNQPIDISCNVIVGTQHIIPYIGDISPALVLFVNADMFAARSAFRSEERFFLVVEKIKKMMSGNENMIVIQTGNPGLDVYGDLLKNNNTFYNRELSIRNQLKFPPFGELISIRFSGRNWLKNRDLILNELKQFGDIYQSETENKESEILWKSPERKKAFEALELILKKYKITNYSVDPTPYF